MRLDGQEESENVEDGRSITPTGMAVGGGVGTLVLVLVIYLLGGDPRPLLQQQPGQGGPQQPQQQNAGPQPEDPQVHFVKVVLGDTEVVWSDLFEAPRKDVSKTETAPVHRPGRLRLWTGRRRGRTVLLS